MKCNAYTTSHNSTTSRIAAPRLQHARKARQGKARQAGKSKSRSTRLNVSHHERTTTTTATQQTNSLELCEKSQGQPGCRRMLLYSCFHLQSYRSAKQSKTDRRASFFLYLRQCPAAVSREISILGHGYSTAMRGIRSPWIIIAGSCCRTLARLDLPLPLPVPQPCLSHVTKPSPAQHSRTNEILGEINLARTLAV
jgi:hypothetical protein